MYDKDDERLIECSECKKEYYPNRLDVYKNRLLCNVCIKELKTIKSNIYKCGDCRNDFEGDRLTYYANLLLCRDCIIKRMGKTKPIILPDGKVVKHYQLLDGVESLDIINVVANRKMIKDLNISFEVGNILKYVHRLGLKDDIKKELDKIIHYSQIILNKINV